jgi:hypothetical protein
MREPSGSWKDDERMGHQEPRGGRDERRRQDQAARIVMKRIEMSVVTRKWRR